MNEKKKIPIYKPYLFGNEKKYVNACIDSTWISSRGRFINKFEEEFSNFIGVKHSSSVSNGTVAIHLALLALDIKPGDEVIVPTLTYVATVNSLKYIGAVPVFIDSLNDSLNINHNQIESKITNKTKAILTVHLYGNPCEMDALVNICKKHNLFLIEDAAEALGSKYRNSYTGTFGDISTFSFFGNKTITTGEGGMVVSNNKDLINRVSYLKSQSVSSDKEYWHDEIGYNYRMTNICAAIGLAQLEQVDDILFKKNQIANWYHENLKDTSIRFQATNKGNINSYWMVTAIAKDSSNCSQIRDNLKENSIDTRPVFNPMHIMPCHFEEKSYPIAESLGQCGFNLPSYPSLEKNDVDYICNFIKEIA